MQTIKIEYLGKGQKRVCLPIPFLSLSEKTGEVICDPIGEFPYEDGMRLLALAGDNGLFRKAVTPGAESPTTTGTHVSATIKKPRKVVEWEKKDFKTKAAALTFMALQKLKNMGLIPTLRADGRWILKASQVESPEVTEAVPANAEGHKEE